MARVSPASKFAKGSGHHFVHAGLCTTFVYKRVKTPNNKLSSTVRACSLYFVVGVFASTILSILLKAARPFRILSDSFLLLSCLYSSELPRKFISFFCTK